MEGSKVQGCPLLPRELHETLSQKLNKQNKKERKKWQPSELRLARAGGRGGLVRAEHPGPYCQEVSKADAAAWLLAPQTFAVGKGPYTLHSCSPCERLENKLQEGKGEMGTELN